MNEGFCDKYYYEDGKTLKTIVQSQYPYLHNRNDATIKHYHPNGMIKLEYYYLVGQLCRSYSKPAVIEYNESGEIINMEYYINDRKVEPPKDEESSEILVKCCYKL